MLGTPLINFVFAFGLTGLGVIVCSYLPYLTWKVIYFVFKQIKKLLLKKCHVQNVGVLRHIVFNMGLLEIKFIRLRFRKVLISFNFGWGWNK